MGAAAARCVCVCMCAEGANGPFGSSGGSLGSQGGGGRSEAATFRNKLPHPATGSCAISSTVSFSAPGIPRCCLPRRVSVLTHTAVVSLDEDAGDVGAEVADAVEAVGFGAELQPSEQPPEEPSAAQTAQLAIEGMTCASCVGAVQTAMAAVPGVESAR